MSTGIRLKGKLAPYVRKLRGIAHPNRLAIMYLLSFDSLWVKDIVGQLGVPQNLVFHHLTEMEKTGWVRKQRDGRHMLYTLNKKAFTDMMRFIKATPFGRDLL